MIDPKHRPTTCFDDPSRNRDAGMGISKTTIELKNIASATCRRAVKSFLSTLTIYMTIGQTAATISIAAIENPVDVMIFRLRVSNRINPVLYFR